jgi:hypothetical protein
MTTDDRLKVDYDTLPQAQKDAFDAWWEGNPYTSLDEIDALVLDHGEKFLQAVADVFRYENCTNLAPTREQLLDEIRKWIDAMDIPPSVMLDAPAPPKRRMRA